MQKNKIVNEYFKQVIRLGLFSSRKRLQFHLRIIFEDIDFCNKIVLDIGGGTGLYSFYAAFMGAKEVICLEPALAGSSQEIEKKFNLFKQALGIRNVLWIPQTFQKYETPHVFDIVISHNSINHLNEKCCVRLAEDEMARRVYLSYFAKLYLMMKPGSKLIICDCSNKNFFRLLGLKNPFVPMIEWEKHQSPKVWIELLKENNFRIVKLKWPSFNRLGKLGNILLANKVCSYFTLSEFCLVVERV